MRVCVILEPPGEDEGFNQIKKVEVQLICDTSFKVMLHVLFCLSAPCLCRAVSKNIIFSMAHTRHNLRSNTKPKQMRFPFDTEIKTAQLLVCCKKGGIRNKSLIYTCRFNFNYFDIFFSFIPQFVVPALFIQWEGLFQEKEDVHCNVQKMSVDVIKWWSHCNPYGRVIVARLSEKKSCNGEAL